MEIYTPRGFGYIIDQLSLAEMFPIKDEISNIQIKFDGIKANKGLVGNIKKEFELLKSFDHIEELVLQRIAKYENTFSYMQKMNSNTKSHPLILDSVWVNFQEKYEFNPVHNHTGVFSFVIWIKIPYTNESEYEASPGKESAGNMSGKFQLMYTNSLGQITLTSLDDEMVEGNMLIFPAEMYHTVYPFYSSDDYRISVSGNFKLDSTRSK